MPARLVRTTPARLATWAGLPAALPDELPRPRTPARGRAWAHHTLGAVVHLALRALFDLPAAQRTPRAAAAQVDRHWSARGVPRRRAGRPAPRTGPRLGRRIRRPTSTPTRPRRAGALGVGDHAADGRRGPGRPHRRPGRRARRRRLQDVADPADRGRRPRLACARHLRRGDPAHAAPPVPPRGAAPRPDRRGVRLATTTTPRSVGTSPRPRTRRAGRRRGRAAGRRRRPGRALPAADLARAAATCEVRWRCPEGRAAAPELEPWALLEG